jgi:hypothetical protein
VGSYLHSRESAHAPRTAPGTVSVWRRSSASTSVVQKDAQFICPLPSQCDDLNRIIANRTASSTEGKKTVESPAASR